MSRLDQIHDELETLNRSREKAIFEERAKALDLAAKRNAIYVAAMKERDSIVIAGIDNRTGQIVNVYDPDLLDEETLDVLEHMGTPVLPVNELYPDGVTIPGKKR